MQPPPQGLRSTKKLTVPDWVVTVLPRQNKKMQDVFTCMFDLNDEMQAKIYTDQTGRFSVRSSQEHQCIMVLINMDSSYINMESMKNRHFSEIVLTYQILIDWLKACGIIPKHHILDNECSAEFKKAIKDNKMTYQLVPPDDHQRNIAVGAIQTGKSHIES